MLRDKIRSAFTKTVWLQTGGRKKLRRFEVPPSERLVLGIVFAITALIGLVIVEVAHMAFLGAWNSEVFAAITLVIGTILGTIHEEPPSHSSKKIGRGHGRSLFQ